MRVWNQLSVGANANADFTDLFTLENTPVGIAGTMSVQSPTDGAYTVYDGGNLTLGGGSGMVNSLSVKDGATLNIITLGAYKVNGQFTAEEIDALNAELEAINEAEIELAASFPLPDEERLYAGLFSTSPSVVKY